MEPTAELRRTNILQDLMEGSAPITASMLAARYQVSRQIIVGDIAILRAAGHEILATPRGYLYEANAETAYPCVELLACSHDQEGMREELYTIVDQGAAVIDVAVEHPIYGELVGALGLSSRYDVDQFIAKFDEFDHAAPISILTGGTHLHHVGAASPDILKRVREALKDRGILIS